MQPEPTPTDASDELVAELHHHVITEHLDPAADRTAVLSHLRRLAPLLGAAQEVQLLAKVADRVAGLGPLAALLDDGHTTDLLINGPGPVWIERGGQLVETDVAIDEPEIRRIIERLTAPSGRRADLRNPVVDLRLLDGSRAHVVLPPVAVDGPYLTIRRFAQVAIPLADFASPPVIDLLRTAVRDRANLVISGGTGSGKTTLLNAMCEELRPDERVITIEDAAELRLPGDHVIRLESRPATSEGVAAVTIADLVRSSLRMRPDRLIVGEVRGPDGPKRVGNRRLEKQGAAAPWPDRSQGPAWRSLTSHHAPPRCTLSGNKSAKDHRCRGRVRSLNGARPFSPRNLS